MKLSFINSKKSFCYAIIKNSLDEFLLLTTEKHEVLSVNRKRDKINLFIFLTKRHMNIQTDTLEDQPLKVCVLDSLKRAIVLQTKFLKFDSKTKFLLP